ncbi:MAG: serine protease [Planctomycetes bacterium]|nr:serine protease [Planctomycetota bacterium]
MRWNPISRWMPLAVLAVASSAPAGGFDHAIESASARVVRLYGAKAGLSEGYGSGILVSDDGLVVTVFSLLLDSKRTRAVTADGSTYGVEVLGQDHDRHLALLRLKSVGRYNRHGRRVAGPTVGAGTFEYFVPGDSHTLQPGDWVVAAGNPFKVAQGSEPVSVTVGTFSTRTHLDARRKTRDFPYRGEVLVIDAITSNPGAPGGALVNLDGEWVGLVGRVVTSNLTHTHLNYAIPVEVVVSFMESVLNPAPETSDASRADAPKPYHGIKLFEMGYQKKLVYVDRVKRGSPAKRAGIRRDDLIISIDGRKVSDIPSFEEIMADKRPGDKLDVGIIRDDRLVNVTLVLAEAK